ncbi:MAG: hypothetical protein PHW75_01575 [Patescibacteria group bacterium]|nr:hypothetical protein [Patescibacteria group bacterium]
MNEGVFFEELLTLTLNLLVGGLFVLLTKYLYEKSKSKPVLKVLVVLVSALVYIFVVGSSTLFLLRVIGLGEGVFGPFLTLIFIAPFIFLFRKYLKRQSYVEKEKHK